MHDVGFGLGVGQCDRTLRLCLHLPSPFFVSGTFDLFNVTCKQYNRTALNPFLNGKNSDFDGTCKRAFMSTGDVWCAAQSLILT